MSGLVLTRRFFATRALGIDPRVVRGFSAGAVAGALHMCGTGESNKLGMGDTRDRETPTPVKALEGVPIAHVACGKYHTAALTASGEVYAWGLESSGQLGLGSTHTKASVPAPVVELSGRGVAQLACGMYHTLALTVDGEVLSCGFGGSFFNGAGGLGHGDREQLGTPAKLAAFGGPDSAIEATSVSAGGFHSIARDAEGGVWSWGRGEWGRLGHNDASDCLVPTRIECDELPLATEAYAGEAHSACVSADGVVYTWGKNEHWQLGYEVIGLLNAGQSLDAQQEPQAVELPAEAAPVSRLACGELGTATLHADGSVYAWGMGRFFEPTRVPTEAVDGAIVDLQLGAYHLALLTDGGRLYTFGTGTCLAVPRSARKSWELCDVSEHALDGRAVLAMACGPNSTALIIGS